MIRKAALLKAGGFPENARYGEDIDMWIRLTLTEAQMAFVGEPLAIYRDNATDAKTKDYEHFVHGLDQVLSTCRQWRQEGRIPPQFAESSLRFYHTAILYKAYLLTSGGFSAQARTLLRGECRPKLCGRGRWLKAYLRALVPEAAIRGYRIVKKFGRMLSGKSY
jgi:hypothetical protein